MQPKFAEYSLISYIDATDPDKKLQYGKIVHHIPNGNGYTYLLLSDDGRGQISVPEDWIVSEVNT